MSLQISVVGVGPGDPGYLTPLAREEISQATVLVGARRVLELFSFPHQETFPITGKLAEVKGFLDDLPPGQKVAVLVTGDPGFYSFLNYLRQHFPGSITKVIPGISSLQLAFARLQEPWHDACLLSLHGRRRENLAAFLEEKLREYPKAAILTDNRLTPDCLARLLLAEGFRDREVQVLSDLGLPGEEVKKITLARLAQGLEKGNSLVIIWRG